MSDNRPPEPDGKRSLIAPLVTAAGLVVIIAGALISRAARDEPPPASEPTPAPVAPAPEPKAAPVPPPALGRADLIRSAQAAASAYASGTAQPGEDLVGRRFLLRIPFGCDPDSGAAGPTQTSAARDPVEGTVRLRAVPGDWTTLPLVRDVQGSDSFEAVEGFWLPRPWLLSEACPPAREQATPASPTAPPSPTLGVARFFAEGGSRVLRRQGRPYEFVRRLAHDGAETLSHSYHLVLEGQLTAYPDGRAVRCWSETVSHPPVCLFSVAFERVAFEDAADGSLLAEWRE